MTPDREKRKTPPNYPTAREFQANIAKLLARTALVGMAAALAPAVSAADEKEKPKHDAKQQAESDNVKAKIAELAKQLGAEKFDDRKNATEQLIALGKIKNDKGEHPYLDLVQETMEKMKKSKDPEVASRAKHVLAALAPPPPPPKNDIPALGGMIIR